MSVIPVILCGGSGTRLWPMSRRDFAKQHVPILGGESPFQRTLRRVDAVAHFAKPLVVTNAAGRFMVSDQAFSTGVEVDILLEPAARDTLAAITAAAAVISRKDPEAVLMVLPSDHLIPDAEAFGACARHAAAVAAQGHVVVLGLKPSGPSTAYGYIRPGNPIGEGAWRVAAFEEKPPSERAQALVSDGCLWNAGMFCFRADVGQALVAEHAPETAEAVASSVEQAEDDLGAIRLDPVFERAPKVSFDYGVMEKTDRAALVAADFEWSDIGDWKELWNQSEKDEAGNACEGDVVVRASRDSFIHASGRLVCALGVEGLSVIDTPDALMVAPLDRTQEVKGLVNALMEQGRPEATTPARVHRPWGWYQTMDLGGRFRVKRIQVSPGKKLSLQKHFHRAEHWVVVRGTAEITRDDETFILRENESTFLPLGCVHRLANPGKIPVEIIEVQTGSYLEEDDIVRIEDDFGRQ